MYLPNMNLTAPIPNPKSPQMPEHTRAEHHEHHPKHTSVHTYALNSATDAVTEDLQAPPRVHFSQQHSDPRGTLSAYRGSGLVLTVGSKSAPAQYNAPSFVSSGISALEVPTPDGVLESAKLQPPGTYNIVVREDYVSTDSTPSIDGSLEEKSKPAFALEATSTTYADQIATQEHLTALTSSHPLPPLQGNKFWTHARFMCLTCYRRLMILVLLANVFAIAVVIKRACQHPGAFTYGKAGTATGANLLAAVLMRQEHVINMLFRVVCSLPLSTPLPIRKNAARFAYSNGGIHSAAGISALLWWIFYTVLLVSQFNGTPAQCNAISATTAITMLLFVTIITLSHPSLRRKYHDYWELCHRYCGYTAIGLVWAQTIISAVAAASKAGRSIGRTLAFEPTFWFLVVITCCLIYPWLWLRRLRVDAKQLSTHATELRFHNRKVPTCVGTRLSHQPLVENHGFATIARPDGEKGYSVLVSHAGDFTKKLILDPPKYIWQRGAPTIGVMRVSLLFKPIVVVTTGSGIGPCMSFLNCHPDWPMRIVWSARFPEATYQREMLDNVFRADRNAVVIDTKKTGHPDLVALAWALVREIQAEAVMVISNPSVTRAVTFAMEARGVAAFGPIFDS